MVSLVSSSSDTMAAGTATLEETESECIRSFILADHDKATQLLPSLHQPAAVRTSYTFTFLMLPLNYVRMSLYSTWLLYTAGWIL